MKQGRSSWSVLPGDGGQPLLQESAVLLFAFSFYEFAFLGLGPGILIIMRTEFENMRTEFWECPSMTKVDLTGRRFGKLVVLRRSEQGRRRRSVVWVCQCDCGNVRLAITCDLTRGRMISCGCLRRKRNKAYLGNWSGGVDHSYVDPDFDG